MRFDSGLRFFSPVMDRGGGRQRPHRCGRGHPTSAQWGPLSGWGGQAAPHSITRRRAGPSGEGGQPGTREQSAPGGSPRIPGSEWSLAGPASCPAKTEALLASPTGVPWGEAAQPGHGWHQAPHRPWPRSLPALPFTQSCKSSNTQHGLHPFLCPSPRPHGWPLSPLSSWARLW